MKKCPAVEPQQASKTNIWARAEVNRKGFAGKKCYRRLVECWQQSFLATLFGVHALKISSANPH